MTEEQLKALCNRMEEMAKNVRGDPEKEHKEADDILCKILRAHGYGKLVRSYGKLLRWFS